MNKTDWIEIAKLIIGGIVTALGGVIVAKIQAVHKELNSRLDQWKKETNDHIESAVAKALIEGQIKGSEIEQARTMTTANAAAAEVLLAAREAAKAVVLTAQAKAVEELKAK